MIASRSAPPWSSRTRELGRRGPAALRARAECGRSRDERVARLRAALSRSPCWRSPASHRGLTPLPCRRGREIPAIASRQRAEKKSFTDAEIARRLFQDHLRRRISPRRPGRPHPEIRRAGAGVRRWPPRRPQGATRQGRRRYRRAHPAPRHRDDRQLRGGQCHRQAGARPRSLPHHRQPLRQRPGQGHPDLARSAMPVRLPQERAATRSSIPTSSSPSTTAISSSSTAPMRRCCSRSGRSTTPSRALDHVQRRCVDGLFRRLRPVHPQPALRPAHQGRHDGPEVKAVLPDVLTDVRAWVKKVNDLPE